MPPSRPGRAADVPEGFLRVIGLMSGTSYDAIEAAAADLTLDGDTLHLRPLGHLSVPYPDDLRNLIATALPPATTTAQAI